MHEHAGIDPPPRKWVGGSFPRPRAREFCSPAPGHPKSGLLGFRVSTPQPPYQGGLLLAPDAQKMRASVFLRKATMRVYAKLGVFHGYKFSNRLWTAYIAAKDASSETRGPQGEP